MQKTSHRKTAPLNLQNVAYSGPYSAELFMLTNTFKDPIDRENELVKERDRERERERESIK